MSAAWKDHERKTAKLLGGKRNSRGQDFSQEVGDVEHALFGVECKYSKRFPAYLENGLAQARRYHPDKPPLLVLKRARRRGELVVMTLQDFVDCFGPLRDPEDTEGGAL